MDPKKMMKTDDDSKMEVSTSSKRKEEDDEDTEEKEVLQPQQRIVVPKDVIDLSDPNTDELEWTGTSGDKLTRIEGLENLKKVSRICFRSNFIVLAHNLSHLANTLTSLEL